MPRKQLERAEVRGRDLPAPRSKRLADAVVASLTDDIVSGRIEAGSVLPPEAALAQTFQVSRITVREAVKMLQGKALVDVRHGVGSVVTTPEAWDLLDPEVLASAVSHDRGLALLDELIRIRVSLEPMLTAEAAEQASATELAEIEVLYHRMEEQVPKPLDFIETDAAFHDKIMAVSGSRLSRAIIRTVHTEARKSQLYRGDPIEADVTTSNQEHLAVLERLQARDPDGASAAMRRHILGAWQRRRPDDGSNQPARPR